MSQTILFALHFQVVAAEIFLARRHESLVHKKEEIRQQEEVGCLVN
jgi:hypothetical protein